MGSADPRSYSRNKRGIAGSLIWINFDRHALLDLFAKAQGRFLANIDDIRPQFQADSLNQLDQTAIFNSALVRTTNNLTVADTIDNLDNIALTEVSGFKQLASPWYSDQILPFDITFQFPGPGSFILPASFSWRITDLKTRCQPAFFAIDLKVGLALYARLKPRDLKADFRQRCRRLPISSPRRRWRLENGYLLYRGCWNIGR